MPSPLRRSRDRRPSARRPRGASPPRPAPPTTRRRRTPGWSRPGGRAIPPRRPQEDQRAAADASSAAAAHGARTGWPRVTSLAMSRDRRGWRSHLRDIPDFPQPGIIFKDITPLLADVDAFRSRRRRHRRPTFDRAHGRQGGGHRGPGLHLRRRRRLPARRRLRPGAQAGQAAVEDRHRDVRARVRHRHARDPRRRHRAGRAGARWSTTCWPPAAPPRPPCRLVERLGGEVAGLAFVLELGFLDGRAQLPKDYDVLALVTRLSNEKEAGVPTVDPSPAVAAQPAPPADEVAPLVELLPRTAPQGAHGAHHPGLPAVGRRPLGTEPRLGRAVRPAPAGGGPHRGRARARRRHHRRRPAPRHGRGHRRHARRHRADLRRATWPPSSTASPSSTGSSSTPRRPSRPPPCARCWWRWRRTCGS